MASNTLWQQSEVVRKELFPKWMLADFSVLTDFISKGEVETVGERDFRIPFQKTFGGRFGHYDNQLGDMGRGSSPTGDAMLQSYYSMRLNFEFDMLQIKATQNKKVAIQNPFLQCIADGYREFELLWDKVIHGDGTAKLATATAHSSGSGVSVYTMDTKYGTQLLRRGQYYTIYDATLTTLKSAGVLYATQINTTARTLTLSGIVPSAAATDVICFEGVSGASPAGPRGLKYWLSTATSGTTANVDRSLEIQIIPKSVDATTTGFSTDTALALNDRLLMDRGNVPAIMGVVAPAQRANAYAQMMAIQMQLIDGAQAPVVDRLPKIKNKQSFMWGGLPHYVDIHQDATIAHYIVPSDWGRARLGDGTKFFETPGKSGADARFIQLTAASGAPAAGVWFGFVKDEDLYCTNPGEQGIIYNLPLGSFYS